MEPLNEKELDYLLQQYEAPAAPPSVEARLFPRTGRLSWWRWLCVGSIRVPVPVSIAIAVLLVLSILFGFSQRKPEIPQANQPAHSVTLADFQLVKQIQPRIIRRGHERN